MPRRSSHFVDRWSFAFRPRRAIRTLRRSAGPISNPTTGRAQSRGLRCRSLHPPETSKARATRFFHRSVTSTAPLPRPSSCTPSRSGMDATDRRAGRTSGSTDPCPRTSCPRHIPRRRCTACPEFQYPRSGTRRGASLRRCPRSSACTFRSDCIRYRKEYTSGRRSLRGPKRRSERCRRRKRRSLGKRRPGPCSPHRSRTTRGTRDAAEARSDRRLPGP